jgi:hypothetical protein
MEGWLVCRTRFTNLYGITITNRTIYTTTADMIKFIGLLTHNRKHQTSSTNIQSRVQFDQEAGSTDAE